MKFKEIYVSKIICHLNLSVYCHFLLNHIYRQIFHCRFCRYFFSEQTTSQLDLSQMCCNVSMFLTADLVACITLSWPSSKRFHYSDLLILRDTHLCSLQITKTNT